MQVSKETWNLSIISFEQNEVGIHKASLLNLVLPWTMISMFNRMNKIKLPLSLFYSVVRVQNQLFFHLLGQLGEPRQNHDQLNLDMKTEQRKFHEKLNILLF